MKLAFFLFRYFPYGGLQRDCLKVAQECAAAGHKVTFYTRTWTGKRPDTIRIILLGSHGYTNNAKDRAFIQQVQKEIEQETFDALIGFNRMPGLDIYYGSDPCYVEKARRLKPFWYSWTPRYRHFKKLEQSVFEKSAKTHILLLTPDEIPHYQKLYDTPCDRFTLLPPAIKRQSYSQTKKEQARENVRCEHRWSEKEKLLLFVGSGFRVKGLKRAIKAMAALPEPLLEKTRLVIIGQDNLKPYLHLIRKLKLEKNIFFSGGCDDVYTYMLASDLLIHPAHSESAGMVLLEALTAGLPVLTTDTCGYAFHIQQAKAGFVLSSPFNQADLNKCLNTMLTSAATSAWSKNGLTYAQEEDLYSGHQKAAQLIELLMKK